MATIPPVANYPISEDAFELVNLLQRVLTQVGDVFAANGVPLPTRQYWAVGTPAEDCAQVVVALSQLYLGGPGDAAAEPQRCEGVRSAVVNVYITRDYPIGEQGRAVAPERIIEASKWVAIDSWLLISSLKGFDWSAFGTPGAGVIATVNALPPNGGVQTTVMNLTLAVM